MLSLRHHRYINRSTLQAMLSCNVHRKLSYTIYKVKEGQYDAMECMQYRLYPKYKDFSKIK